ncbi:hypothetical protein MMC14_010314 [Varicellaria rhodocarpa]|nr:hypothetical protein [Varicellaria rhodocarpa]
MHLDWPPELQWITDDFIRLGASSTLQSLGYEGRAFDQSRPSDPEALRNPLLPALRQLYMSEIHKAGLLHLFSLIPLLENLLLETSFKPGSYFLRYLSGSSVRDLEIGMNRGWIINQDDLVALAQTCPLLESLRLGNINFRLYEPGWGSYDKTSEAITEFARHAVNLRCFEIHMFTAVIDIHIFEEFDLTPRPPYKFLTMPTWVKTSSIHRHRNDQSPLFPCLEWLEISSIEMDMYIRPSRLLRYLPRAAPLLMGLIYKNDDDDVDRQSRRIKKKWDDSHRYEEKPLDERRQEFF